MIRRWLLPVVLVFVVLVGSVAAVWASARSLSAALVGVAMVCVGACVSFRRQKVRLGVAGVICGVGGVLGVLSASVAGIWGVLVGPVVTVAVWACGSWVYILYIANRKLRDATLVRRDA